MRQICFLVHNTQHQTLKKNICASSRETLQNVGWLFFSPELNDTQHASEGENFHFHFSEGQNFSRFHLRIVHVHFSGGLNF